MSITFIVKTKSVRPGKQTTFIRKKITKVITKSILQVLRYWKYLNSQEIVDDTTLYRTSTLISDTFLKYLRDI